MFGLVGVIVGGLITGGVNYFLDERRAKRDETKEKRKRLTHLKRAARLVDDDFSVALTSVVFIIENKRWLPGGFNLVRFDSWEAHRVVLATETTLADWGALQLAVRAMKVYQAQSADEIALNKGVVIAAVQPTLQRYKDAIEKGCAALKPYLDLAID